MTDRRLITLTLTAALLALAAAAYALHNEAGTDL